MTLISNVDDMVEKPLSQTEVSKLSTLWVLNSKQYKITLYLLVTHYANKYINNSSDFSLNFIFLENFQANEHKTASVLISAQICSTQDNIICKKLDKFVKRSDVTGNRFEWQLEENNVI